MAADRIAQVPDNLVDGVQEWVRHTDDDDIRGVCALQRHRDGRWSWQVDVWVAEFVRDEPLESELRLAIAAAIRSVNGVTEVAEETVRCGCYQGRPAARLSFERFPKSSMQWRLEPAPTLILGSADQVARRGFNGSRRVIGSGRMRIRSAPITAMKWASLGSLNASMLASRSAA